MILGVPVFAVIYTLISDSVNNRLRKKKQTTDTNAYYSVQQVSDLPQTDEAKQDAPDA